MLKIGNYRIPLVEGQKIYKCQALSSMNVSMSEECGTVIKNPTTGKLGIKNVSGTTWAVSLPNGEIRNVENDRGLPAIPDLKIRFNHGKGHQSHPPA